MSEAETKNNEQKLILFKKLIDEKKISADEWFDKFFDKSVPTKHWIELKHRLNDAKCAYIDYLIKKGSICLSKDLKDEE